LGSKTSFKMDPLLYVIVEDPNDPVWSTFACLHRIVTKHLPLGYKGHIFCKRAPEKVLKVRREKGDATEAHWDPVKANDGFPKAAGKLGKNQPTSMFRALAQRCGFADPERFTSRSARRTGISMLAKTGVDQHILNAKARHSDTATNALYYDPHETALADASIALHFAPAGKYFSID
jgi:integrase